MDTRLTSGDVYVTSPHRNYVIVRLETADGLVGWGDATLNGREKAVEALLEHHVLPELQGHDASRIEDVWQMLFRQTYWRGGPVLNTALAGVDMALWDLKGKEAGMPVYDLLGGRTREYAAVYEHCGADTTDGILENCRNALDLGIEHLRVNPTNDPEEYLRRDNLLGTMETIREALGPEPELIIDVHGRLDPIESARVARELEPIDLFFLEDPIRPENKDAFEVVRERSVTPLAMGELFSNPWEMIPLVEERLVDYIRTDLAHVGGVTPARKLATIGEHHYVRTAFHGPFDISPIGYAATVHLDLAVPNFGIQEMPEYVRADESYPGIEDVFQGGVEFVRGSGGVDLPDEPGLGVSVDLDAVAEHSYEPDTLPRPRNKDGSVQDW